jgi:hypothetical protein|tara:strand:- start:56 stop:769 length:714 start_codon:yes stop_codon:yes gene_type:complete
MAFDLGALFTTLIGSILEGAATNATNKALTPTPPSATSQISPEIQKLINDLAAFQQGRMADIASGELSEDPRITSAFSLARDRAIDAVNQNLAARGVLRSPSLQVNTIRPLLTELANREAMSQVNYGMTVPNAAINNIINSIGIASMPGQLAYQDAARAAYDRGRELDAYRPGISEFGGDLFAELFRGPSGPWQGLGEWKGSTFGQGTPTSVYNPSIFSNYPFRNTQRQIPSKGVQF